ncbi:MAG: TonB-dependent receptor [Bacteroidetes bacterium]|nr:MAG: TonB-dependent receptor [Bacteroidota bacterium]
MRKILQTILTIIIYFLSVSTILGQWKGKITGTVKMDGDKSVSAASVELLKAVDSGLVKATASDNNGNFQFDNLNAEKYLLRITAVGFNEYISNPIDINAKENNLNLENLVLKKSDPKQLKEVKLTTRKPLIEQKMDKTVVNVDASISNAGSTVMEVLEKSPGVIVDKDGNVSLKGKQGVVIMIDGKPTYLNSNDLANYLRSLPASAIEQLEIMTNPPAKYDAAGNSGVINIRTKKNRAMGFNGSISANYAQGKYWRTNESINLNYRIKKFNFFANYTYSRWSGFQNIYVKRNFFSTGSKNVETIFEQQSYIKLKYPGHTYKVGADYFLSSKTTIGVVVNGNIENGDEPGNNTSYIQNGMGEVNTVVVATNSHKQVYKNLGTNFNIKHRFDSTGKELSADFDYVNYNITGHQHFQNEFFNPAGDKIREDEILKGYLPSRITIYSAKSDYTHPLGKSAKLEAGVKASFVKTDNDAQYYLYQDNDWLVDTTRTNHFVYNENIFAGYLNFSRQLGKWSVQAGLRVEHTDAKGKQYINDSSFTRNYTSMFPTAYVSYTLNDKNQFGFSFGRRIERPSYQDLNPFRYFLDPYTFEEGNPFLKPQFSYNVELSHTYRGVLTTTLNYTKTVDMIAETLNQIDKDTITYVTKQNLATAQNLGAAISFSAPVNKWFTTTLYTNIFYATYSGTIQGSPLHVSGIVGTFNMNNQFDLGKGWTGEVSGWARSNGIEGQFYIKAMGQLDLGVQKSILKKQGSLKFSVTDVFYTNQFKGSVNFNNIDVLVKQNHDSRAVRFTFTYRFGKSTSSARQRSTGAEDEQSRVKHGS